MNEKNHKKLGHLLLYLLLHGHSAPGVKTDENHDNQDMARYLQLGKAQRKLKSFVSQQFFNIKPVMDLKYICSDFWSEVSGESQSVHLHRGARVCEKTSELALFSVVAHHQEQDSDVCDVLPKNKHQYQWTFM